MYKIIGADRKEYGPVSAEQLRQWAADGRVNAQTLVQAEGQTDWRPLASYPEFATLTPPSPGGAPGTPPVTTSAQSLVSGPAIALMIVGILYSVMALLGLFGNLLGWGLMTFGANRPGLPELPPQVVRLMQHMGGAMGVVLALIQLALSLLVIFASVKLRKLESYVLVTTATILSMIPCFAPSCCCLVGLPMGIWILVVINKPEVRAAFH